MGRRSRVSAGFFLLLAPLAAALVVAGGASAADVRCEQKVLADWSDNGRVDGVYPLRCYQEALAKMPTDLRDYTNATDAIHRALTRAVSSTGTRFGTRVTAGAAPQLGADRTTALPLPLMVLVGVSAAVLSAGTLAHLARRRRMRHA